eukprot:272573-Hanusia_phi.AAC.1
MALRPPGPAAGGQNRNRPGCLLTCKLLVLVIWELRKDKCKPEKPDQCDSLAEQNTDTQALIKPLALNIILLP